jgi:hypothetical protein
LQDEVRRIFDMAELDNDKLVDQLKSVTERSVSAWHCPQVWRVCRMCPLLTVSLFTTPQCSILSRGRLPLCEGRQHAVAKVTTKLRFFTCDNCRRFLTTLGDRRPSDKCQRCGGRAYTASSLYHEKMVSIIPKAKPRGAEVGLTVRSAAPRSAAF